MAFFRKYFSERAQRRLPERQAKSMIAAIGQKDVASVERLWDDVEDKASFVRNYYSSLVSAAAATDDLKVFRSVFRMNPDPNFIIRDGYMALFVFYDSATPLLNWSITRGAKNIALFLAKHPEINPDLAETEEYTKLPFSEDPRKPTALERASRTPGMEEVVIALGRRKLQNRRASNDASP